MKTINYLFGLLAIATYSCSSLTSTTAIYSDDIYYDAKKEKSENNTFNNYSPSASYSSASTTTSTTLKSATSQPVTENRNYSQAQAFYSEEIKDTTNSNNIDTNQSYAERIAKFQNPVDSLDYYSSVYSDNTPSEPTTVNIYVNDNYPYGYGGYSSAYYGGYFGTYPYIGSSWNSYNGWNVGFGMSFGYPYYGYGYPYYGYGHCYYGYGYDNYYPYCGYGCYPPYYGSGGGDYYPSHSNRNYGPRPDGGSHSVRTQSPVGTENTTSYREPRSVASSPANTSGRSVSTPATQRYSNQIRSSSSEYGRSSLTNGTTRAVATNPQGSATAVRRNYTPSYTQPANNARSQYNSSGNVRPATSSVVRMTSQPQTTTTYRPTVVGTNENTQTRTSRPAPAYQSAPSQSNSNYEPRSGSGGGNSRPSSGGGGSSAPSQGGGGSRAPRR